jgi:cytochrome c peroxidase
MIRALIIILFLASAFSCAEKESQTFESKLKVTVLEKIDTLGIALVELENKKSKEELIQIFRKARKDYKKIEPFVEYYFQGHSRRINGPALPEIKIDDNIVNDASGFQVLEELIFTDSIDLSELKNKSIS